MVFVLVGFGQQNQLCSTGARLIDLRIKKFDLERDRLWMAYMNAADCAEAIGSRYQEQHVGTFGDISTFNFYGNKTITTGEGGMIVTGDKTLYMRILHLKNQGLVKYREYWHDIVGYNYRMTNICAAIELAQLEHVSDVLHRKRKLADTYKDLLHDTPYKVHPEVGDVYHSYWMTSILVPQVELCDPVREHLAEAGIETRPVFYPVHTMPMYSQKYQLHKVAEDIGWRGINLPSYPALTEKELNYTCEITISFEK